MVTLVRSDVVERRALVDDVEERRDVEGLAKDGNTPSHERRGGVPVPRYDEDRQILRP